MRCISKPTKTTEKSGQAFQKRKFGSQVSNSKLIKINIFYLQKSFNYCRQLMIEC